MSQPFERHTTSFILRLWVEPMQSGESQWRGQIEHVETGEKTHFQVPAALVGFLIQQGRALQERGTEIALAEATSAKQRKE